MAQGVSNKYGVSIVTGDTNIETPVEKEHLLPRLITLIRGKVSTDCSIDIAVKNDGRVVVQCQWMDGDYIAQKDLYETLTDWDCDGTEEYISFMYTLRRVLEFYEEDAKK